MSTGTQSPEAIRIKLLLEEERKSFMHSIRNEFRAYLIYKFEAEATPVQIKTIHERFSEFESLPIPESLIQSVLSDGQTGYNWFYDQVNAIIRTVLAPARIEFGSGRQTAQGIDMMDLNGTQ